MPVGGPFPGRGGRGGAGAALYSCQTHLRGAQMVVAQRKALGFGHNVCTRVKPG